MSWERFQKYYLPFKNLGFALDISRMNFPDSFLDGMAPRIQAALADMRALEAGAVANPDEGRMAGHYWLRRPELAPVPEIRREIENCREQIKAFARNVHEDEIAGHTGMFENLLVIGIGGSALGPQFVSRALGHPFKNELTPYFLDNTDPDGIDLVLDQLRGKLDLTLVIVISKSGGTPETRNGMLEVETAYKKAGLDFPRHAVAITKKESRLDVKARKEEWLARFPMWDWVGGRTSITSAAGLLPAALQGIDTDGLLRGAAAMDEVTRQEDFRKNPAALLALMWYHATNGRGEKDMVIIPYKDRLMLFSRYLQQLIMESLGKELDLNGKPVFQGITVYGNKGSTDQHAYIQQLRDGVPNFFATFIEVLRDRAGKSIEVEPDITSGDYLQGFLLGTRSALHEKGRESITITIKEVSAEPAGQLIALYERATGLYASLAGINAYHQPGVEAGKKAAAAVLEIKKKTVDLLRQRAGESCSLDEICGLAKMDRHKETVFKVLEHLAANPGSGVTREEEEDWKSARYHIELQAPADADT